jgi:hypothetical protein
LPRRRFLNVIGAMPMVRAWPMNIGHSPYRGQSPDYFGGSYGGAEPRLTSGGEAATAQVGRQSRNCSHRAAKPQLLTWGGEAATDDPENLRANGV